MGLGLPCVWSAPPPFPGGMEGCARVAPQAHHQAHGMHMVRLVASPGAAQPAPRDRLLLCAPPPAPHRRLAAGLA